MNEERKIDNLEEILEEYRTLTRDIDDRFRRVAEMCRESGVSGHADSTAPSDGGGECGRLGEKIPAFLEQCRNLLDLPVRFLEVCGEWRETARRAENLREEKIRLETELARFSEQVMVLGKENENLSEEVARLQSELDEASRAGDESLNRVKSLEKRIEELQEELSVLKNRLKEEEEKERNGKEEYQSKIRELNDRVEDLESEKTRLEEKSAVSEAEKKRLEEELATFCDRTADLEKQLETLQEVTVSLEEHEKLKGELETLRNERRSLEEQEKQQTEKVLRLEEEIRVLRSENEEIRRAKSNLESSLNSSEGRFLEAQTRIENLQSDLERITRELQGLQLSPPAPPSGTRPSEEDGVTDEEPAVSQLSPEPTEAAMFDTDPATVDSAVLSREEETPSQDTPAEVDGADEDAAVQEAGQESTQVSGEDLSEVFTDTEFETRIQEGLDSSVPAGTETEVEREEAAPDETLVPEPKDSPEELRADVEGGTQPGRDTAEGESEREEVVLSSEALGPEDEPTVIPEPHKQPVEETGEEGGTPAAGESAESETRVSGGGADRYEFPYPEITGEGLGNFHGRRVLLVGGDARFRADYEHLFGLVDADLIYFPAISNLERNGMKRHVREVDLVIVFGAAVEEPGINRLRIISSEYGRYLLEHRSSGLVSLYHRLKAVNRDL